MGQGNEYIIRMSEKVKVRLGILRSEVSVVYAGMVNDMTYSIAIIWTWGNQAMAYNLYFRRNQRELLLPKGKINVISINEREFRFTFSQEQKIN